MFYEDDYEYFSEPSEADNIILQAEHDLREILDSKVKEVLDEVKNASQELDDIGDKIAVAQQKLNRINYDIEKQQKEYEKGTHNLSTKFIQNIVHEAVGDFAPGDEIYFIKCKCYHKKCSVCGGTGKVVANIGNSIREIKCPECDGYKEKRYSVLIPEKGTISKIDYRLCFHRDYIQHWSLDTIILNDDSYESNYNIKDVYKTKEECEAAIKERANKDHNKSYIGYFETDKLKELGIEVKYD